MKKSITIHIPEPCHEDWQKMTQTEKGKFCSVCTKEVIDFTSKTDEDLVKILSDSKNTCGRFKKTQLNREVKLERKSGLNLAPYAASLLLPLSLLNTTHASSSNNSVSEKSYSSLNIGRFSKPNRAIINTKGIITDAWGKGLNNVIIRASESKKIVKSDMNGNYSITAMDHETLSFESDGFLKHKIELGSYSSEINISMISEVIESIIMDGVVEIYTEGEIEVMGDVIEVFEVVSISGTVRDQEGLILPGVNIIVEGTEIVTQSDLDGNYSLDVEANQTLQFIYIGFTSKSVAISNISNHIDVNLETNTEFLGGAIFVVGAIGSGDYEPPVPPPNAAEMDAHGKARKLAFKNEREFKHIKHAREKAARKLKKSLRK
jgi:hypothetical protein